MNDMSMLDYIMMYESRVTKLEFGRMIHSDDESEVNEAMAALEAAGGYDNLED